VNEWWSIEVADGDFSASGWKDTHGRDLIRTALEHGATDWAWVERPWGVVLELCFPDQTLTASGWELFRASTLVQAALDAVPDPVNGLLVYSGRGGSSASPLPRKPKPAPVAAAAALPIPEETEIVADVAATIVLAPPVTL
jgi:hypothetical protein